MKKFNLFLALSIFAVSLFGQEQPIKPKVSQESKQVAKKNIESYRQRVIKGEKISTLAILYSEDPGSSSKGGFYTFGRGVMDPAFESAAFSLKPGEISEVFETSYGYHFIQLVERKGDTVSVRHILIIPK